MLYSEFFDLVMSHSLTPQITLPTRLTSNNGTLIDNIFCKLLTPISNTHAGIHINRLSDNQPCFIFIKTRATKENPPKRVHIKHITQLGLFAAAKDMEEMNLCAKLDKSPMANVNQNYNKLYQEIHKVVNQHTITRTVKFNKHKHKKSNWFTYGVLKSIKYRDKLYKLFRRTPCDSVHYATLKINLRTYNNILRKVIRSAKITYYETKFKRHKQNIKNTWATINEILSKSVKTKTFPAFFMEGQTKITEDQEIANRFNTYFINIGPNQSKNIIYNGDKTHKSYLTHTFQTEFKVLLAPHS